MQLFPQALPTVQMRQQPWASDPMGCPSEDAADAIGDALNPTIKPATKRKRFIQ